MSELSLVIDQRRRCLDALEDAIGTQPTSIDGRAAMTLAQHCLRYVSRVQELDTLRRDLQALADSARAGEAAPALAVGVESTPDTGPTTHV